MFSFGAPTQSSTSSLNSTHAASSTCLYAPLNQRHLLELNCSTLHLSLITPAPSVTSNVSSASSSTSLLSSTTTSKHLYTIEGVQGRPSALAVNSLGSSLAIAFEDSKTIVVLRNLSSSAIEAVQIHLSSACLWMDWHPLSPGDAHLAVLTRGSQLLLFDTAVHSEDCSLEAESVLKLPANRLDPLVRCSFVRSAPGAPADWSLLGLFLVSEAGDVRFLAPFLPRRFKVKRVEWIEALLEDSADSADGTAKKWLQSCLHGAKFLSTSEGDTDWILVDSSTALNAFDSLQSALQGPFAIQPEPLEIHHLSSFDRVSDFAVLKDGETMAIAFGSGKVDLLAFGGAGFGPAWQLPGQAASKSESAAVLILLESIDVCSLKSHSASSSSKRSVSNSVKFIHGSEDALLVSPGNDSVISIRLNCSEEAIDCSASIVASALKAPAQSVLMGRVFPGAIAIELKEQNQSHSSSDHSTSALSPDLMKITKYAFPLGKMEIEGAALQLEGLLESTLKALTRLKQQQKSSFTTPAPKFPTQEANEEDCAALNDHVNKWQQDVVMPAMRVGHELALRAQELVQILRTQRQVLSRAHSLLTSKPERLQNLIHSLSAATQKNSQLQQRMKALKEKMPAVQGRLGDGVLMGALESMNSRLGRCMSATGKASDLVDVQLTLQTEMLTKLQKLLLQ